MLDIKISYPSSETTEARALPKKNAQQEFLNANYPNLLSSMQQLSNLIGNDDLSPDELQMKKDLEEQDLHTQYKSALQAFEKQRREQQN